MDAYLKANQETWNMWTRWHVGSKFYNVEGFKAGTKTLDPIALAGAGDVTGKSLLHLQCHFEMDTVSWARLGAHVTGVDFSEEAIEAARTLASELGLPATFIHSNLYDLPQNPSGQFDVVFTSHGVLGRLPDLEPWARVIAHFLKPGGIFYIVEAHPAALLFDEHREDAEGEGSLPYHHTDQIPLPISPPMGRRAGIRRAPHPWPFALPLDGEGRAGGMQRRQGYLPVPVGLGLNLASMP
jgi:SAM-dependent methyltransferase